MQTERAAVIGQVADVIPVASRPLLVAVDGRDGAGKTTFADELAGVLDARGRVVVRASIDGFHHPRDHRHRLGRTAESVWTRHFDYRTLRRELLDPWLAGAGSPYRPAWHDVVTDEQVGAEPELVPDVGVLVVDGVFAQRPELAEVWDLVVFLEVPVDVALARLAARDGSPGDPEDPDQQRYVEAQRRYVETCRPRERADVVVDNRDLDRPVRVDGNRDGPPDGWSVEDGELVRSVRLPVVEVDAARHIDEVEAAARRAGPR